ncbi:hypothetical protein C8J57DRAFT_1300584 [Mycena rebaudengoi]|nr:hypothetical protein C8J57DRAFT_1300584 [Mycena rebaudengoi]
MEGHTANHCKRDQRCRTCGATDHLRSACPSAKALERWNCLPANLLCYVCHSPDHLASNCPVGPVPNFLWIILQAKKCHNCGVPGHIHSACPQKKLCNMCRSPDHLGANCPAHNAPQVQGHRGPECPVPEKWTNMIPLQTLRGRYGGSAI